ncbi:MAG: hypothetical protein COW54_07575 [Rhodobacteraceae bacterium CG17_big_fil_post_rev_8_21_14_2_50_63_15]|nr:MAG: hypothetical protein COW54_07575 [Rhodobacteraceae bacterium CG17_big_fil_post_rev_8_21_14_2_50_63_15]
MDRPSLTALRTSRRTSASTRLWAPKGDRLPGAAPFGHWNTSTFIAALRHPNMMLCRSRSPAAGPCLSSPMSRR